jgi:hypothetical protein
MTSQLSGEVAQSAVPASLKTSKAVPAISCRWRHGCQSDKVMKTLFHGIRGSRVLRTGEWIQAVQKPVSDGGTVYTAGFHVLRDRQDCQTYLERFTRPRDLRIIPVMVAGLRPKEHSPYPVLLADWMLIPDLVRAGL